MTVWVDDAMIKFGKMRMSHMIAQTSEELLDMARTIGVQVKWIQHKDTPREHFDICGTMRKKAIASGAVKVTQHELVEIIRVKAGLLTPGKGKPLLRR